MEAGLASEIVHAQNWLQSPFPFWRAVWTLLVHVWLPSLSVIFSYQYSLFFFLFFHKGVTGQPTGHLVTLGIDYIDIKTNIDTYRLCHKAQEQECRGTSDHSRTDNQKVLGKKAVSSLSLSLSHSLSLPIISSSNFPGKNSNWPSLGGASALQFTLLGPGNRRLLHRCGFQVVHEDGQTLKSDYNHKI